MSPVLAVLVLGLVVGAILVWRLARRDGGEAKRELERADLQRRQEELYERLRAAREVGDAEEIAELEHQAAVNLRDLEALGGPLTATPETSAAASETTGDGQLAASAERRTLSPAGKDRRRRSATGTYRGSPVRSGVVGFIAGLAVALLLVTLFYFAQRDARPRPAASQPPVESEEHPAGMALSDAARAELDRLRAAVEGAPGDLSARKRYALALLTTGQLFPAFQQSREILAASPEDPDGLYITAFVRLEMGQTQVAVDLFDRLLARHPEHIPALVGKGLARARAGDADEARTLWQRALRASGGDNPQVERFLAALDAQAAAAPASGAAKAPTIEASGTVYTAIVRLAEGAQPPHGAVLFVTLRGAADGPPAAVRRVADPTFPLEVTLSAGDSMLGRPLPESGTLAARLDGDGNASTRQPEDLAAEVEARQGTSSELTLARR